MSTRIPEPPSAAEAEGIPDTGELDGTQEAAGVGDGLEPPHDTALAVDDFGTTAEEMHDGESLDGRVAREQPEVLDRADVAADESAGADTPFSQGSGQGIGRLVEPDEGARTDETAEMVATDAGTDLGGYSAEESAMHLEPEA